MKNEGALWADCSVIMEKLALAAVTPNILCTSDVFLFLFTFSLLLRTNETLLVIGERQAWIFPSDTVSLMKSGPCLTRSHALAWCYVSWGTTQWAPQGFLMSAKCACACVRAQFPRRQCCVNVESQTGATTSGGKSDAVTRCVQWPHTVSLFLSNLIYLPPLDPFPGLYLFSLHFIYLIGVPELLLCMFSHVGFPSNTR